MEKDPFKEYLKESEPNKAYKGYVWSTAIGLQAVDGLRPSKYLIDIAIQNIEGKITMEEAKNLIESLGGKVTGSVTGKTNYLINNDVESTSSKNKKARELGVPIISEDEFVEMLK